MIEKIVHDSYCKHTEKEMMLLRLPFIIKRAAAAIGAAVMLLSFSSCGKAEIHEIRTEHKTKVPPKMMYLGDSIAAGYGLEGYKNGDNYYCRSYSNILKEKYEHELEGECGHTMVNMAVSGYTSADLIAQIQSGELDSELKDSDAVVISIGGNDLLGILFGIIDSLGIKDISSFDIKDIDFVSAGAALIGVGSDADKAIEQFGVNMDTITAELKKRTEGTIFVQTLYDPVAYYEQFSVLTDFAAQKILKLNNVISEKSANGYKVIDVASDFTGRAGELTNIKKMDIHPNEAGHQVIAEDVDKAFRAEGFSYVTTKEVKDEPSYGGRLAVICGIAGGAAILLAGIILLARKKSKK